MMTNMASGDLSLTSTSSQEEESPEYLGYDRTLRPPSNSSGSTAASNMANNNNNNGVSVVSGVNKPQYDAALMELTTLRHQHADTLRRCDDLSSQLAFYQEQYMAAINRLESNDRNKCTEIAAENAHLKQQNNLLERKLLRLENENGNSLANPNSFYCDYASANAKCNGTCPESEKLLEELQLCKEQNAKERSIIATEREKYKKNLNVARVELENLKKERNFYLDPDLVEKENQRLKSLLAAETNKVMMSTVQRNRIEEELNQLLSEKDNVLQEHQKMSDDLSVANKEIDKYKKDELLLRSEIKSLQIANSEFKKRDLLKSRESSWSKEFSDSSKDDAKENEKLRKSLEKALSEVERAMQEIDEAKSVRDWAISQREKIVQERESVKTLCDNLRKERDKAISDQLSAIRDSEKIKKQKDEAEKKIDVLTEQLDNQNFDSTSRRSFRMSAYEAEDLLEIELCNYHTDSDLGLILDDSHQRTLVCGVTSRSPAFGKLKINDIIYKVNNRDCNSLSKRIVFDEIRSTAPRCKLMVARMRHSKRHFYTVKLNLEDNPNHGLSLDKGVFIAKIEPNSLADMEPELEVGDRVLSINNKSMDGIQSVGEVMSILHEERHEILTIFALKTVQDVGGLVSDSQRRMTTKSAQTDSVDSMHRVANTKNPSKIAEVLRHIMEKIHISKPGTDVDHFAQEQDALKELDSVLSENSSEKSKENIVKRKKPSKKEKEAANKSLGTWPRTTILNVTHENHTGTIGQREKKRPLLSLFTPGPINVDKEEDEPPPLPPQIKPSTLRNINSSAIKTNPHRSSNPMPTSGLFQSANANGSNVYTRHSVYESIAAPLEYDVMDNSKILQRPAPIPGNYIRSKVSITDKYGNTRANSQNRYSLNFTPAEPYKTSGQQAQQQVINTGNNGTELLSRNRQRNDMYANKMSSQQPNLTPFAPLHPSQFSRNSSSGNQQQTQQQQQSLDMISNKSQNSIDSILSTKSPPISDYAIVPHYPKRAIMPMPQALAIKNVAKYPSDSESIASSIIGGGGGSAGGLFYHSSNNSHNAQQTHRPTQLFPTFTSTHPMRIRHSSPLTMQHQQPHHMEPATGSNAIGIPSNSVDKFDMDYVSPVHNHHTHSYTHEYMPQSSATHQHYLPLAISSSTNNSNNNNGNTYEGGTFPRKKDLQRLRIPSNPSVASKSSGVKNSSGSIDHHFGGGGGISTSSSSNMPAHPLPNLVPTALMHHHHTAAVANGINSGRGSPMPLVHVEILSHGGSKRNSNVSADFLCPGDLRRVTIEKSDKPLGITIQCNKIGGGIFVSGVAEKSIATQCLREGDQLLEVCGINMRSATNDIAANVLRQCGNSITMLVQYNPEKFHSADYDGTNNLEPESPINHSGSPTPRNSPRPPLRTLITSMPPLPLASNTSNQVPHRSIMPQTSTLMSSKSIKERSFNSLENQSDNSSSQDMPNVLSSTPNAVAYEEGPRFLTLRMDKSKNLGIKLFGGNKVGIFVHDVHPGSPSDHAGIRKGDQILEYNGVDLRCVTAEQAATEISKLSDNVTMMVQNKLKKLKQIKDKSGDSFYIRVGFDRTGDLNEGDLRFVKDEVLYVDNSVFNGTFGLWRAWKLDAKGHRKECGIIPSQMKVEEEIRSGESADCEGGTARRASSRRSFFRRKKHQRSSSRDSTEIASFSNTQLSFFPDTGMLNDDGGILSYQRVERLDSPIRRPVLIIGPLSECVMDRLTIDFSNLFKLCEVTTMDCSLEAMAEGLQKNIFVDYRRRSNKFECTTVETINNACKNDRRHCILDISISAVERLQRLQIYPIVLLLRFKSAKQIREIRDFSTDKISAKAAKEMYERAEKLETDYKQYISAVIPGVSIKHMVSQIKDSVDKEQDKLLWVPVANGSLA